jgi:hypothetical protein
VLDPDAPPQYPASRRATGAPLVLPPTEPLVDGGSAEQLERSIQRLIADGHRHLIVDLDAVALVADGRDFPVVHVESVFARNGVIFEPRDVSQGRESAVKYHVSLDRRLSLDDLSAQLTAGAAAIRSVVWKNPKKSA